MGGVRVTRSKFGFSFFTKSHAVEGGSVSLNEIEAIRD